jgi:hypothetical protein
MTEGAPDESQEAPTRATAGHPVVHMHVDGAPTYYHALVLAACVFEIA